MALKICEHCSKAYLDGGEEEKTPLCPDCADYLETLYRQAWTWLRDHSSADGKPRRVTSARLAEVLGVDAKSIEVLVKMDRIQTSASLSKKASGKDLETLKALRRGLSGGGRERKGRR